MSLADHIVAQLAEEDIEVTSEQIQGHIDSYEPPKPKGKSKVAKTPVVADKPKGKAKVVPAKKTTTKCKSSEEEETHTCEKTVNGKEGPYVCGKNATNEMDGMWYCGTDKSGHYNSVMKKSTPAKGKAKAPTKTPAKTATKTSAKATAKVVSKGKSASIIQKVTGKAKISLKETSKGSGVWVDLKNHRIVYTKDPQEAYGILDDDDETVLPLTEEAVSFVEAHNIPIQAPKKAAKKAMVPKSKGKTVTPKKVAPKGKKAKEPELEELIQDAEDIEVEPEVEEGDDGNVEDEEASVIAEDEDIDLGDDEEEPVDEDGEGDDEDAPDIEEGDEGEAIDEEPEEEEPEEEE